MAKENKINNLTDVMTRGKEYRSDFYKFMANMKVANVARANGCYSQAWEHYYNIYLLKYNDGHFTDKDFEQLKGEAAYKLCKILQNVSSDDSIVRTLAAMDRELMEISRKNDCYIDGDDARTIIGRRFLYEAANYNYTYAKYEYALNCLGYGTKKSFVYDRNDETSKVAVEWAENMLDSNRKLEKLCGEIIYGLYNYHEYKKSREYYGDGQRFCESVMRVKKYNSKDAYSAFLYAIMISDPDLKCFDPKLAYQYFGEIMEATSDETLYTVSNSKRKMLKYKYPSLR